MDISQSQDDPTTNVKGRQANLDLLVERSPDIVARFDRALRHLYVNPAIEGPTGTPRSAFVGKTHDQLDLPTDVIEAWKVGLSRVFELGVEGRFEVRFETPEGPKDYQVRAIPETAPDGTVTSVIAIASDFTERKRFERQLKEERRQAERQAVQLRGILDNMAEGVTVRDTSGRVILRNKAAADIVGIPTIEDPNELVHLRYPDGSLIPAEDKVARRLKRAETFVNEEFVFTRPDGEERRIIMNGSTVRGEQGNVSLLIQTFHDVTQLRRLEESERTLLHIISHDLRSPLAAAQGFAQLLARELQDARHQDMAERIVSSLKRMNRMVRDLADSARLDSGQLALSLSPVDLLDFVVTYLHQVRNVLDVQRVEVIPPSHPCRVVADVDLLERILANLVANALKYSAPPSTVTISLTPTEDTVILAVSDTGVGIAAADLPHVFDRYYRSARIRSRGEGLGLGLYIARGLVEAHQGTIRVESELGKGTTFSVELPATAP